jgi:hypothetical protein
VAVDEKLYVTEGNIVMGRRYATHSHAGHSAPYQTKFLTERNILCGNSSNKLKYRLAHLHICMNRPIDGVKLTKRVPESYIHVVLMAVSKHVYGERRKLVKGGKVHR